MTLGRSATACCLSSSRRRTLQTGNARWEINTSELRWTGTGAASEAGDDDAEDEIYHDDAVLEYPQSRERILGRLAIRTTRGLASQQALHHSARDWAMMEAVPHCQYHGVQGWKGLSRDAVLR